MRARPSIQAWRRSSSRRVAKKVSTDWPALSSSAIQRERSPPKVLRTRASTSASMRARSSASSIARPAASASRRRSQSKAKSSRFAGPCSKTSQALNSVHGTGVPSMLRGAGGSSAVATAGVGVAPAWAGEAAGAKVSRSAAMAQGR